MRYLNLLSNDVRERCLHSKIIPYKFLLMATVIIMVYAAGIMIVSKTPVVAISYILAVTMVVVAFIRTDIALLFLIFMMTLSWVNVHLIPARGVTGENLLFIAIFIAIISKVAVERGKEFVKSHLNLIICLYFLVNFIAWLRSLSVLSDVAAQENSLYFFKWMQWVSIYYLVVNIVRTNNDIKRCIFALTIPVIVVAIMVVSQHSVLVRDTGGSWIGAQPWIELGGVSNPCASSIFIAFFCPVVMSLLLFSNSKIHRFSLTSVIGLFLYAIMCTYSRGSYVAITVGLFFIFLIKDTKFLILFIVILVLAPWWLPDSVVARISYTFAGGDIHTSGRIFVWGEAIQLFLQNPLFGIGYGVQRYSGFAGTPHSFFLKTLAEVGLLGFGILIWLFVIAFKNAWYVLRNSNDGFLKALALGFIGSEVVIIVHSTGGWGLVQGPLKAYFFILLALVVVAREVLSQKNFAKNAQKK